MKECTQCGEETDSFAADKRTKDGLKSECRSCHTKQNNVWLQGLRQKALDHYGRTCRCCGESIERFLCIDHINNDGAAHRTKLRG